MGLLLLRAMLGGTVGSYGTTLLSATESSWILGSASVLSGLLLSIGFLTPLTGVVVCVGVMIVGINQSFSGEAVSQESAMLAASVAISAASIALLGPGAISVDARLFGRREILIPKLPGRRDA